MKLMNNILISLKLYQINFSLPQQQQKNFNYTANRRRIREIFKKNFLFCLTKKILQAYYYSLNFCCCCF